jgi:hypothetical protein
MLLGQNEVQGGANRAPGTIVPAKHIKLTRFGPDNAL